MQNDPRTDSSSIDLVKSKLMHFSEKGVAVANRNRRRVRDFAILGTLSALWITFYLHQLFALSAATTGVVLIVLLAPGLTLGKTYFALREIGELPGRLESHLGTVKNSVRDYKTRMQAELSSGNKKSGLSDVIGLGRDFRELVSIARDSAEISSLFGGALVLSNPAFLLFLLFASGVSALIFILALVTLIAYMI